MSKAVSSDVKTTAEVMTGVVETFNSLSKDDTVGVNGSEVITTKRLEIVQSGEHELCWSGLGDFTYLDGITVQIENTIKKDEDNIQKKVIVRYNDAVQVEGYPSDIKGILSRLSNAGVIINGDVTINMRPEVDYFKDLIREATKRSLNRKKYPEFPTNKHEVVGWQKVQNKMVYFGNTAVGLDNTSTYAGELVSNAGSLENWVNGLNDVITPKVIPSIVMASAFAGVIRQRYPLLRQDTQLVFGLIGDTSKGKTTVTRAAHSVFANPLKIMDYNGTEKARHARLAQLGPMCGAIDDIMRMDEVRNADGEKWVDIIFTLVTGQDRDRLTCEGYTRKLSEYFGSVYVSATKSILAKTVGHDAGQSRRFIELNIDKGDEIGNLADIKKMGTTFGANYGFAAEAFAEKLLEVDESFVSLIYSNYLTEYESMPYMPQLANRYAMISLCADLCNQFLGTEFDLDMISEYLKANAEGVYRMFNVKTNVIKPRNVEQELKDYFCNNIKYFHEGMLPAGHLEDIKRYLGVFKVSNKELIIRIPTISDGTCERSDATPFILMGADPQEILDGGFELPTPPSDYNDVMRTLRAMQLIQTSANRLNKKGVICTNEKQFYLVEFHIKLDQQIVNAVKQHKQALLSVQTNNTSGQDDRAA